MSIFDSQRLIGANPMSLNAHDGELSEE